MPGVRLSALTRTPCRVKYSAVASLSTSSTVIFSMPDEPCPVTVTLHEVEYEPLTVVTVYLTSVSPSAAAVMSQSVDIVATVGFRLSHISEVWFRRHMQSESWPTSERSHLDPA